MCIYGGRRIIQDARRRNTERRYPFAKHKPAETRARAEGHRSRRVLRRIRDDIRLTTTRRIES